MRALLGFPATTIMLASSAWASYLIARRVTAPAASLSLRLAGAALVWLWLGLAVFNLLTALHLFRLVPALVSWLILAGGAHAILDGRGAGAALRSDVAAALVLAGQVLRSPLGAAVALGAAIVVGARLWSGLASPPLAWDAFLYHAYKPARWVQQGHQIVERAPDIWGYLEFFPHAAEVPLGWAMLGPRSDALLALAGAAVWAINPLAAYAAARVLGAHRVPAALSAAAVGFLPALITELASTYGDMYLLASFLLGCAFLTATVRDFRPAHAVMAAAGFGLMVAGKSSGLPVIACVAIYLSWLILRAGPGQRLRTYLAAFAAIAVPALPGYLRTFLATGSPFYPLTVQVGDRVLIPGNEQLHRLFTGALKTVNPAAGSLRAVLEQFLIPRPSPIMDHLGLGPQAIVIAVFGLAGFVALCRRPQLRGIAIFLALIAALPFLGLMSKSFEAQRILWINMVARLALPLPAMLAVMGARFDGLLPRASWAVVLAIELWLGYPGGLVPPVPAAMAAVLPAVAVSLAGGAAGAGLAWRVRGWLLPLVVAGASAPAGLMLERVRATYRYPIYAAASNDPPAYVMHNISLKYMSAWPIWKLLDDGTPHRVAASFGWISPGPNAFRYPLLGAHFQNRVLYIPISRNGEVVDYEQAQRTEAVADAQAWLGRLAAADVDTVVLLHPPPPLELAWIETHPELFEPIPVPAGANLAFRFHGDRLRTAHPR